MSSSRGLNLTLKIWRQPGPNARGEFRTYEMKNISPDMSFLEMLDVLNEQLIQQNDDPVVFDHDCREGICGMCSLMINGQAHGPDRGTTTCQLHMRRFNDGDTIVIEPWRAKAFPVLRDLAVDRAAFDRIITVPQGEPERARRVTRMVAQMDKEGFGGCTNTYECEAACPAEVSVTNIARLNREYLRAVVVSEEGV